MGSADLKEESAAAKDARERGRFLLLPGGGGVAEISLAETAAVVSSQRVALFTRVCVADHAQQAAGESVPTAVSEAL